MKWLISAMVLLACCACGGDDPAPGQGTGNPNANPAGGSGKPVPVNQQAAGAEAERFAGQIKNAMEGYRQLHGKSGAPTTVASLAAKKMIPDATSLSGSFYPHTDFRWTVAFNAGGRYTGKVTASGSKKGVPRVVIDYSQDKMANPGKFKVVTPD